MKGKPSKTKGNERKSDNNYSKFAGFHHTQPHDGNRRETKGISINMKGNERKSDNILNILVSTADNQMKTTSERNVNQNERK